jgi:GAF domain-containing protein
VITASAALRVAVALVLYLSGSHERIDPPLLPWPVYVMLAACFGLMGLALTVVNRHDVRAAWLGGIFILVAAPLTSPFFVGRPMSELGWLWFLRADAFLPAFLWRFGAEFPSPLVGTPARVFRTVARTAMVVGLLILIVNLSLAFWPDAPGDLRLLLRPPTAAAVSLYYPLLYGLTSGAFAALIWRASRGRADEKRRLMLFAIGLTGGAMPLLLQVLLETIPAYYRFVHRPGIEQAVGSVVLGALGVIPFVTGYSVLFDRVVDLKVVLRAALQYALARYTLLIAAALPFAALLVLIYRERAQPLVAFASGARPLVLGGTALAGLLALRLRRRLVGLLNRRFFREPYDTHQMLDQIMSDALHAGTSVDLETRLRKSLTQSLHADVSLFVSDTTLQVLARPDGSLPIHTSGVLVTLACGGSGAMDVDPSDSRSPFRRLPADEQQWLLSGGFVLIVPLRTADQRLMGLLALAPKRSGLPYSMDDRRFLAAIATSAVLALDNLRLRTSSSDSSERAARECQSCSKLNGPDAVSCACGGPVTPCAAPHTLRGIYRLDRRIGAGGMGVVYLARDLNLDRAVAIKTLPVVSPQHSVRLRTEGRAMAAVQHPNLAVIHGIETWQGTPFLVQEFLAGGTLADRLSTRPMAVIDAVRLGATIAQALDYLHAAGIVHCDIKPSNIGFTERDVPKLLDFGLAKLPKNANGSPDTETETRTADVPQVKFSDTVIYGGTPAYMAPEALDAVTGARPALDLWALGVVLCECLTGRRPFGGTTRDELKISVSRGLQQPPSHFNDRCPPALDALLLALLHPQPAHRPATAREVWNELEHLRVTL